MQFQILLFYLVQALLYLVQALRLYLLLIQGLALNQNEIPH
jgi:thiaminase